LQIFLDIWVSFNVTAKEIEALPVFLGESRAMSFAVSELSQYVSSLEKYKEPIISREYDLPRQHSRDVPL
jgi:hypothetical protein